MRPADLAREHGISTQAVRNYERDGCLPAAERTPSGYRVYTEVHAAALRAYISLIAAHGHAPAGRIMRAVHRGRLDEALAVVDEGHRQSLRDRATLDAVREAVDHLMGRGHAVPERPDGGAARTIGGLARRLGVTPATLRNWEEAGILAPAREPATGYRVFRADDVRDAELAHLLRRGGYPLEHIAEVVRQVRAAGDTEALAGALEDWRNRLTARGVAMLGAAAHLGRYLELNGLAGR
ncbi:TioE family transcriptional regulator [Nocardiopsis dassonvillei]|uniref:TioE family transcriptional regulator n=1 Tax=Nocardiopsis dassonvillei TaxID=2014 RepID=UPI003F55C85C